MREQHCSKGCWEPETPVMQHRESLTCLKVFRLLLIISCSFIRLHLPPVGPVSSEAHLHEFNNRFQALSQPVKNGWSRNHQMSRSTFLYSLYGHVMSCSIVSRTNSWQDASNAYRKIVKNIQSSRSVITARHLCKLSLDSWRITKKSTVRRLLPLINATTYTHGV